MVVSIASISVLVAVSARSKHSLLISPEKASKKAPVTLRPGAFFIFRTNGIPRAHGYPKHFAGQTPRRAVIACLLLLLNCSLAAAEFNCAAPVAPTPATLAYVHDGDTLWLKNGDKVRLIGINTPEVARDERPAEAVANAARQAVVAFFAGQQQLLLVPGGEARDRYGRRLAHVYRPDGQSLEAYLLARGLGFHIAIPPNLALAECLHRAEQFARSRGLGVWSSPRWQPLAAEDLTDGDAGFRLVRGRIRSVTQNKYIWVKMEGPMVLRIAPQHAGNFKLTNGALADWQVGDGRGRLKDWRGLVGREVEVRGWLIDRHSRQALMAKGFARWRMDVHSHYAILFTPTAKTTK